MHGTRTLPCAGCSRTASASPPLASSARTVTKPPTRSSTGSAMRVEYALAWLLPLLAGSALCALAAAPGAWRGRSAAIIGSGWLAGVYLVACAACLVGRDDTLHALAAVAPWLAAMTVAGWVVVPIRRFVRKRRGGGDVMHEVAAIPWQRAAWWLLLALVLLRLLLLGAEAAWRPVFPWDAWSAWALKPKSWILLGHVEPYVPMLDWLADPYAEIGRAHV